MPSKPNRRASARQRGYTTAWERERSDFLADPDNQFCVKCKARGLLNPGTMRMDGTPETNPRRIGLVVDHIIKHEGDHRLFWDRSNWQPLCHDDHDITKQREEHGRQAGGCDINGRPTSPDHPWNRAPWGGGQKSRTDRGPDRLGASFAPKANLKRKVGGTPKG